MISSTSSKPTDKRIRPSFTPASARSFALKRKWVVVAGWVMVVLASPKLLVIETARVLASLGQADWQLSPSGYVAEWIVSDADRPWPPQS